MRAIGMRAMARRIADFGRDRICTTPPVTLRELPNYAITRIRTGQYLVREDGSTAHLRGGEIRVNE